MFDREDEGEAYAAIAKAISAEPDNDINILGQPKLDLEPQVRLCPGYNYVIHGDVRVSWSSDSDGRVLQCLHLL